MNDETTAGERLRVHSIILMIVTLFAACAAFGLWVWGSVYGAALGAIFVAIGSPPSSLDVMAKLGGLGGVTVAGFGWLSFASLSTVGAMALARSMRGLILVEWLALTVTPGILWVLAKLGVLSKVVALFL
jgi:hypothetical protein